MSGPLYMGRLSLRILSSRLVYRVSKEPRFALRHSVLDMILVLQELAPFHIISTVVKYYQLT